MINDERILALFEEANPVPVEQALEQPTVSAAAYLAALDQGRMPVTQLETRVDESGGRRSGWWLVAAAVVAIAVGTIAVLVARSSQEPPVASQPTTTVAQTSSTEATDAAAPNLSGGWSDSNLALSMDGTTYTMISSGNLFDVGTYEVGPDGSTISLVSALDSPNCGPGDRMELSLLVDEARSIELEAASDDCRVRQAVFGATRVLAADPSVSLPGGELDPRLEGDWEGEGIVISLAGGQFSISLGSEVLDRGTYRSSGVGDGFTITTTDGSLCDAGDSRDFQFAFDAGGSLTLRSSGDECLRRLDLLSERLDLAPAP